MGVIYYILMMSSYKIIFLAYKLTIRISKEELLFISIRGVHKLCNFRSFKVMILLIDFKSSILSNGT
mgnify:CR=1 FL=1